MTVESPTEKQPTASRVRASEKAIVAALNAVQASGLTVHKLLVNGGKVEIITHPIPENPKPKPNGGGKQW